MELWKDLNDRQQRYMEAIYKVDQLEEDWARQRDANFEREPAEKWRWLMYLPRNPFMDGSLLWEHIPVTDEGTGSTFNALERRGYILCKYEDIPPLAKPVLFVRMTTQGRKLVRTATGEERPRKMPAGTLREWHWQALAALYQAGEKGLSSDYGDYGGFSWNTMRRLRDYQVSGVPTPLFAEKEIRGKQVWNDEFRVRRHKDVSTWVAQITDAGRSLYRREWTRYRELYPDVAAPDPGESDEQEES